MSDFESLLNAIPENPNVAFILADYLEEQGDPRCELLRLSYTLKDLERSAPRGRSEERANDLQGASKRPGKAAITPERLAMEERMRELILVEKLEPVAPRYTNEFGMEFVWIPPGRFLMGSPQNEPERHEIETQHEVTLTRGFWLQTTAVTQKQWEQVMGNNPSEFRGEELPAETVSWHDCQEFCQKVTERTGRETLLPTEAQWEYACRAGTTTPFWFGKNITTDQVNYHGELPYDGGEKGEYREQTVAVKSFPPNGWGLYEMHGNVWEWCRDWYGEYGSDPQVDPEGPAEGHVRVIRGGSWDDGAGCCRSAYRAGSGPEYSNGHLGFRCAQVPE